MGRPASCIVVWIVWCIFFSLRDRYPEEHCGFGYDLHSVNFCEDKYLGYAKLPPFLWGSHLIIGHLAYMYLV